MRFKISLWSWDYGDAALLMENYEAIGIVDFRNLSYGLYSFWNFIEDSHVACLKGRARKRVMAQTGSGL